MSAPTITLPYPSSLPLSECMDVVAFIRGTNTDQARFIHSAWVVEGYGLSQWKPAPMTTDVRAAHEQEKEVADILENAIHVHGRGGEVKGVIPWGIVIPVLIQIIMSFFQKKDSGDEDPWKRPDGEK